MIKTIFKGKIITLPNILSFARLMMISWYMWMYLAQNDGVGTALIVLLSGFTDIIDGVIARRFNMISNLGKALDPLADKLTLITVIFCLVWRFPHMWLVFGVLCVKELFVLVTSLMAIRRTEAVLPADLHGKITTAAFYIVVMLHLFFIDMPPRVSDGLICLCTVMLLLSGVLYGIRNIRAIRSGKE